MSRRKMEGGHVAAPRSETNNAPCVVLNFPTSEERAAWADKRAAPIPQTTAPIATALRTLHSDTFFHLPFVTLPETAAASWREFWSQTEMWNDEPTGKGGTDFQRGREYARLAIDAIRQDNTSARQLEITVERMISRAFSRRGPRGRLCRRLSPAEQGFISVLCKAAVLEGVRIL